MVFDDGVKYTKFTEPLEHVCCQGTSSKQLSDELGAEKYIIQVHPPMVAPPDIEWQSALKAAGLSLCSTLWNSKLSQHLYFQFWRGSSPSRTLNFFMHWTLESWSQGQTWGQEEHRCQRSCYCTFWWYHWLHNLFKVSHSILIPFTDLRHWQWNLRQVRGIYHLAVSKSSRHCSQFYVLKGCTGL